MTCTGSNFSCNNHDDNGNEYIHSHSDEYLHGAESLLRS